MKSRFPGMFFRDDDREAFRTEQIPQPGPLFEVGEVRPAAAVRRAKSRHDHLRSRQIHDGLMSPAFGVTPGVIDQNPLHPGNGGEIIDMPVPLLSLPEVTRNPVGQPPFGAAGVDVIAGGKEMPAQGSDPDLDCIRKMEQKVIEATFSVANRR